MSSDFWFLSNSLSFPSLYVVVERLSTDIEWLVEIHCCSDDRSVGSSYRFIIITENFVIFSYFLYVSKYPHVFSNILGCFLNKLTDLSPILGLFISATIFTGSKHFW